MATDTELDIVLTTKFDGSDAAFAKTVLPTVQTIAVDNQFDDLFTETPTKAEVQKVCA